MKKYLYHFETESEYNQERSINYIEPWVSYTNGKGIDYNKTDPLLHMPFTFSALGSGNISWALGDMTVLYSKNGSSWDTMTSETTIPVVAGDEVQFKGENSAYYSLYDTTHHSFSSTANFNLKGNIMSLTNGDDFISANRISSFAFEFLFEGCSKLKSVAQLRLPVMVLASNCYYYMFRNCSSLTDFPELPATSVKSGSYGYMFAGCTSLATAPELPATTLRDSCYIGMFDGCTSLATAPELPATTLAQGCYQSMFRNCTNLRTAPILPATTLTSTCYRFMFNGCTKLNYIKAMFTTTPSDSFDGYTWDWVKSVAASGTFVKNSAAQWDVTGTNGIPSGWTVEMASS